jgi:chromosome segregation ATPase
MEQGLFKDEVKTYKGLLDEANTSHKNSAKTADDLQQELSATKNAQNDLATENKTLGTTIEQLQESLKTAQRRVTMAVGELARRTEDMGKKAQEQTSLRTMVKALQTSEGVVKKEAEDLKGEYKNLQEKFKNQGSEYSKLFTVSPLHKHLRRG